MLAQHFKLSLFSNPGDKVLILVKKKTHAPRISECDLCKKTFCKSEDVSQPWIGTDNSFQDGSLEARIYAKMTLKLLMEHQDFDRILKKNVTANTLRNLEKILDSVRNGGLPSASSSKRRVTANARIGDRGKTL